MLSLESLNKGGNTQKNKSSDVKTQIHILNNTHLEGLVVYALIQVL